MNMNQLFMLNLIVYKQLYMLSLLHDRCFAVSVFLGSVFMHMQTSEIYHIL